jgi:hypothetical protein
MPQDMIFALRRDVVSNDTTTGGRLVPSKVTLRAGTDCVNCHARHGRSKRDGGITPSVLAREVLTWPHGTRQPGGQAHPPYDERTLVRAITFRAGRLCRGWRRRGNRTGGRGPRGAGDRANCAVFERCAVARPVHVLSSRRVCRPGSGPPGRRGGATGASAGASCYSAS